MISQCPFCTLSQDRIWFASAYFVTVLDGFPIAEGHTLVIPKRHVSSVFELPQSEANELWPVVVQVRGMLQKKYECRAFNIGINDGEEAGQTIKHAHIHIIPRRPGDVQDPRGGIRWLIPEKAKYW